MRRERVRNFSGTCPWVPPGAGRLLSPPSGVRRGRSPRRRGRLGWAGAALVLLLAAPVGAQTTVPPVITSATTFTLDENTTAVATLTATDADADSLEWSIPTDGGADAEQFTLTTAGVLTFSTAPDYEVPADADTDHVYEVTVQVSDGTIPVPADLEVTVENVTELTTPITGPATMDYAENDAGRVAAYAASSEADRAGIEWILAGADAEHFSIDTPAGVLRFDIDPVAPNLFPQLPDYEAPADDDADSDYEITLLARVGASVSSPFAVTVTVTDTDEAGAISLSSARPRKGSALTATLTDPDTVTGTPDWTWERSAGRSSWHVINGETAASYTPTAAAAGHYLRVSASYTDGRGSGKTAQTVAPNVVLARTLSRLEVATTSSRQMYPAFDPEILHYAVGCIAGDTLTLTLSTTDADTRLAVDGVQYANQNAVVELGKGGESDIPITLTGDQGGATTYVLHCFQEGFPNITTEQGPGATEELIGFSLRLDRPRGYTDSYIMIVDNNGVPRVHRRIGGHAPHFRPQNSETYPFSYPVEDAQTAKVWILVDRDLNELERVTTVSPLRATDGHDFIILDNGDYLLMSYEPVLRDFSSLTGGDGNPPPPNPDRPDGRYPVQDTAFQIRTPAGAPKLTWYSWDHMAAQDCGRQPFPVGDWAHGNSLWMADGVIVASFRACGKVLGIDAATGDVAWRLGRSYRSPEEWGRDELSGQGRGAGPAPMTILNDPYGEFCGQHSALILDNGHLLLYDNGHPCVRDPARGRMSQRKSAVFSRAVEYAIDPDNGEAIFQRHHSLHGDFNRLGLAAGLVKPMGNGDWLISWGWDQLDDDPDAALPPDESVTQVDPDNGTETFSINIQLDHRGEESIPVRAHPLSPVALAAEPIALTAELPASSYTSVFNLGVTDSPQVVVAFSRPVVDFDETTPSLSVTGATVASVSAHVVAGELANAYLVTLTPDGDGAITFRLASGQACGDGGVCTAGGTLLSAVPTAAHTIPGPVTVSFGATSYAVTEGGTASVVVELNRAHGRADGVEMPLVVQTGGTATEHTDYAVPASVTFGPTETSKTVSVVTVADASIEGAETVVVAFGALPTGVTAGTTTTTTVTITDQTAAAQFTLTLTPPTVVEGNTADVTVAITNRVTFATAQPLTLTFSGSAAQGTDYTVTPTPLTLLAEQPSATTTLHVTDDPDTENAETIEIAVAHRGTPPIPTQTATIPASDQPAITPHISVYAGPSPAGEAEGASFTVTRTGTTTARLTVAVRVTESGSLLEGPPPTTVTFAVGQENVRLPLPTVDDTIVEGVSATSVVTVAMQADTTNDPPLYLLGSPASAQVTVEDDDVAEFEVTVSPNPVPEGTPATVTVAITTGVTFPADQTLTILVVSDTATQGTDYTVGATTLTLVAGETSVPTVVTVLDDKAEEPAETLGITAEHGGQEVGQAMLTIAASADTAPPTLEQAEVPRAGRSLRLTFSEPLDEANVPPSVAFVVTVDDNGTVTTEAVTSVVVSAETVTVELADPVLPGQGVTVDYTVPSSAWPALQDPAGNEVVSFADEAVDNQAVRRPVVTRPPSGGGGGGGSACTDDLHGNSAAQASAIALATVTPGAICPVADVDYFTVTAPSRGLLFVDTTGSVNTRGTLWQDGTVLASGPTGRSGQAARLGARVEAGDVVVAVQGQGGATGAYEVIVTFTPGYLENPGPDSFQSGIGVLSGWVCEADMVEIELNGVPQEAAYGTERLDTAGVCGDTDNGFGLLFNWNLLRDGEHTVVAFVDGVELGRATVMVTTLGQEFLRDVVGTCEAEDFPSPGETVTLVWQQNSQNFVIAGGSPPAGAPTGRTSALTGFLENPGHNSFQSGVRVLSGWVCDADTVELAIGTAGRQVAAYGTERLDTLDVCGDTDNGFGLLFNWNLLGEGEHAVVAYVDDVELGRATVRVTTLGEEFLRGAEGECVVEDFPTVGETVTLAWQQNQQNFVVTAVE